MSATFAVFTSDPNLLQCELLRLADEIVTSDPSGANAVGLGSYAQEDVLFQRFRSPIDLKFISRTEPNHQSEALLYHAGQLPLGMSPEDNTQPFRYRRWMFCHGGTVPELAGLRKSLIPLLPDFLRRQVRGDTGSDLVFALFLKHVRDAGGLDDPLMDPAQGAQSLGRTIRLIEEVSGEVGPSAGTLNCIATNGSMLVAARRGREPLFYALLEGSPLCARCGIEASTVEPRPLVRAHQRRRTVAVASHPNRASNWIEIPDGSAIAIGEDLNLKIQPI
jgi:glutamine amidotransferase